MGRFLFLVNGLQIMEISQYSRQIYISKVKVKKSGKKLYHFVNLLPFLFCFLDISDSFFSFAQYPLIQPDSKFEL